METIKTRVKKGINDLLSVNPELASEWHPTKNPGISPDMIAVRSNKIVWWLGKCGHEWQATVDTRNGSETRKGTGCPYCSNKKVLAGFNDLASKFPEIAKEWDYSKNKSQTPETVVAGSNKKVWWKCSVCSHEWAAQIHMRISGQGCPECAKKKIGDTFRKNLIKRGKKSLADEFPEVAAEWHPEKNKPYLPTDFVSNSNKKVYWKCSKCDYEWKAIIENRTKNKSGCPVCAGNIIVPGINDLLTKDPDLAAEWHPTKNLPLTTRDVGSAGNKKVWWICRFGHEYQCRISDRKNKGVGCSECSKRFHTSDAEQSVLYYIEKYFNHVISRYRPAFLAGGEIDIFIPEKKIGIEYDGQRYHQKIDRDIKKDLLCTKNGITLIRIREPDCPIIERVDKTYILKDLSEDNLSAVISLLLQDLGIEHLETIDIKNDKQSIKEYYLNSIVNGSIAEDYPEIAKEWDYDKNGELRPENIPATYSKDKYFWKCTKCGYVWKTSLGERIRGSQCPVCTNRIIVVGINDLATTHPDLVKEWHPDKNLPRKPQDYTYGSNETITWKCSVCGTEWQSRITRRVNGSGCPKCSSTKRKKRVFQYDLQMNLIAEYESISEAAKQIGVSNSAISMACTMQRGTNECKGFIWTYEKQ